MNENWVERAIDYAANICPTKRPVIELAVQLAQNWTNSETAQIVTALQVIIEDYPGALTLPDIQTTFGSEVALELYAFKENLRNPSEWVRRPTLRIARMAWYTAKIRETYSYGDGADEKDVTHLIKLLIGD